MYSKLTDKHQPITLLLKGAPGTGKTWKAAHFPKPVIFNFDNNTRGLLKLPLSIRNEIRLVRPHLDSNEKPLDEVRIWDNFVSQLEKVVADPSVGTIIIDSLSTLSELLMDKIIKSSSPAARVEIQHWGDFRRYLKALAQELLANRDLDKHVIFIGHEQIERDELTQSIVYSLNMGGSMRNNFDLYFTDCWRTYVKQTSKGIEYWVRTVAGHNFSAKTSLSLPQDFNWDIDNAKLFSQISPVTVASNNNDSDNTKP